MAEASRNHPDSQRRPLRHGVLSEPLFTPEQERLLLELGEKDGVRRGQSSFDAGFRSAALLGRLQRAVDSTWNNPGPIISRILRIEQEDLQS
jgi:hypothetical protein